MDEACTLPTITESEKPREHANSTGSYEPGPTYRVSEARCRRQWSFTMHTAHEQAGRIGVGREVEHQHLPIGLGPGGLASHLEQQERLTAATPVVREHEAVSGGHLGP